MVEWLKEATEHVALGIEVIATLVVVLGVLSTVWLLLRRRFTTPGTRATRRDIWVNFAGWLIFGLEFQIAADIVRTAIEPSWQQIGQLAAIATIRTALNYFLGEDLRRSAQPTAVARTTPTKYEATLPRAADRA
jgi:uncharacterized membrane protein